MGDLLLRLRALLLRGRVERELDDELRFHVDMQTQENIRRGLPPDEARRHAVLAFGGVERFKEECRDARGVGPLEELLRDVRYGARVLRRNPVFTAAAVVTLALGVGANTAVFSVVYGVLLRPLPYDEVERVLALWETDESTGARNDVSPGNFMEWRDRVRSFERIAIADPSGFDLTEENSATSIPGWRVSEGFFETLGARPLLGRTFLPEEYAPGGPRAVILSYGAWQRWFGGDPGVLGSEMELDGRPAPIVGVLPPEVGYPEPKDLWMPLALEEEHRARRTSKYMFAVGRLAPGVSAEVAEAELRAVAADLAREYPATNAKAGVRLVPLREQIVGEIRPALLVLVGAVALLLLIACANVASLLLARMSGRGREFAVRSALGAGSARLLRQVLVESSLLGLAGGAAGVLLAYIGVRAIVALSPADLPRLENVGVHAPVLIFTFAVSVGAALLVGLAPAVRALRTRLGPALAASARSSTAGRRQALFQRALVVTQVALALMLLIGAGLLVRSFALVLANEPGFQPERRIAVQAFLWDRYPDDEGRVNFLQESMEAIAALPGVTAVAAVSALPVHPSAINVEAEFTIEGRPEQAPGESNSAYGTVVTPGYFAAMGIPLRAGRDLAARDRADAPRVAVVNEAMARRFWPGENPIGERVRLGVMGPRTSWEIVGIVGDVRPGGLETEPRPELFVPHAQSPTGSMTYVVRTAGAAAPLLVPVVERIWELDPRQAIYHTALVEDLFTDTLRERRLNLVLLGGVSLVALVLALVGVYGLISFLTSQRARELGIRSALGARPAEILLMVLRQGMLLAGLGIVLGVAGALGLTRFLASMLFAVEPTDARTFLTLVALTAAAAFLAVWVPARRAARVEAVTVLNES